MLDLQQDAELKILTCCHAANDDDQAYIPS